MLLGPPGAVVIQVEPSGGEFAVEGDTWYRYGRGKPASPEPKPMSQVKTSYSSQEPRRRLDDSPTWASIRAAREVKAWLSVRGLPQVVVQPLVILGNGHIRQLKRPSAPVIEFGALDDYIRQHLLTHQPVAEGESLAEVVVEQIANRLQNNGD